LETNIYNPITSDPPTIDRDFPAEMKPIIIDSYGSKLNGIIYLAPGSGSHPTAILLHGFPGNERNLDLAQAIRRAGWNAVYFNYRGSWGSEGNYLMQHTVEDTLVVLDFLHSKRATDYRIDPETIALIGHSMGGACAFAVAIQESSVQYVASLAGANLGAIARLIQNDPVAFENIATSLKDAAGPLTGFNSQKFLNDLITNHDQYDVKTNAEILAAKVVLMVGGSRDETTTLDMHYWPMLQALQEENASQLTHQVFDDDHSFSSHRIALARLVISWLKEQYQRVSTRV